MNPETERPEPPAEQSDHDDDTWICCCECGIEFGVPARWAECREEDGRTFYCPNGHPQYFGDSPLQAAQQALAATKGRNEKLELDLERAKRPWWKW